MTLPLIDQFNIPAELAQLQALEERIAAHLDRWADVPGLEMIRYQMTLAVQEICVNIIEHAYAYGPGTIDVAVAGGDEPPQIEITLRDSGRPFDPAAVAEPNLDDPQEGGLGLFLVRHLMDRVDYRADAHGNKWRLLKYLLS